MYLLHYLILNALMIAYHTNGKNACFTFDLSLFSIACLGFFTCAVPMMRVVSGVVVAADLFLNTCGLLPAAP